MSDGMERLDQTHAVFSALSSFWWRVLLFFAFCMFGHYVGVNIASAGRVLRNVWSGGLGYIYSDSDLDPFLVPVSWLWTLLVGCEHPAGLLQLFLLGAAFLFVWLSEDRFVHGFAIALLAQPLHSFLVVGTHESRDDFIIGLIVLVFYESFAGFAYWWCLRQME